ncbi:unnamed protein product [Prunus armeniaca]|uniref:Uncharacterized protein n=1 Tax=Prunus armeniaca TaxID=36596 RepID=A0A6J5U0B0_PRUAR|nr:unnamed protein product [Prunus armeniaca]CAB4299082.1 unnamed protein product [Prunus armeniaca]
MIEVHKGICSAHQAGIIMRWLLRRHAYYWLTILKDCQKHGLIQHVPTGPKNPIVKAWPFKGWEVEAIPLNKVT